VWATLGVRMAEQQKSKIFPIVACIISLALWFVIGAIMSWLPMISHGANKNPISLTLFFSWVSFHAVIILCYLLNNKIIYIIAALNLIIWFLAAAYVWSH